MKNIISRIKNKFFRTCENNINYSTMLKMQRQNKNIIVLDVRTRDEYAYNHLQGAINIPLHEISQKVSKYITNKNEVIIVYCEYGGRSKKAANKLEKMGYMNVYNLDGGIQGI